MLLRGCKDDVSLNFSELVDDSGAEGPKLLASNLVVVRVTFRWEGLGRSAGWMIPDDDVFSPPKAWTGEVTSGSDWSGAGGTRSVSIQACTVLQVPVEGRDKKGF